MLSSGQATLFTEVDPEFRKSGRRRKFRHIGEGSCHGQVTWSMFSCTLNNPFMVKVVAL